MSKQMTDWFPVNIKPVHVGIYETDLDGHFGYSFWTGKLWCDTGRKPGWTGRKIGLQNKKWRGFKEKQ